MTTSNCVFRPRRHIAMTNEAIECERATPPAQVNNNTLGLMYQRLAWKSSILRLYLNLFQTLSIQIPTCSGQTILSTRPLHCVCIFLIG